MESHALTQQGKDLGKMMHDDHAKINEEIESLADRKQITLTNGLSSKKQEVYDKLAEKSGIDLDKDYASQKIKDHKKDIDEFRSEAEKGSDEDVKQFATGKIATLQRHLTMSENALEAIKKIKEGKPTTSR
ncbi:MAG: DUF4142 domain-containing protein [Bacteroidetes bacterium]|nr:DUF4142 domain-containing protein [Bacteroidota bacterium]